jgi:hypothetical protein
MVGATGRQLNFLCEGFCIAAVPILSQIRALDQLDQFLDTTRDEFKEFTSIQSSEAAYSKAPCRTYQ